MRQAGLKYAGWRQADLQQAGWLEVMGALAFLVLYWEGCGSPGFAGTVLGVGCGSPGFAGTALGRLWEPWLCWYCTGGGLWEPWLHWE